MEQTGKRFRKREAILACVRATDVHPSAEWVHTQLRSEYPDLSLGTVYRNLSRFKQEGLIASLGTVDGVERFDGNVHPHVHFLCSGCGCVLDLPHMAIPSELSGQAAQQSGGQVQTCHLSFSGLCSRCKIEKNI